MSQDNKYSTSGELTEDCQFLKLDHHSLLFRFLQRFKGQKLEINFQILRYKRSDAQNRYIWGVIVPCVRAWWLETYGENKTPEEIYTWLRIGLLGHKPVISKMGDVDIVIMQGKRFSKMNTKEFEDAMKSIREQMSEKDCVIPEPHQNNFLSDIAEAEYNRLKDQ